jgi:hypothetical protein
VDERAAVVQVVERLQYDPFLDGAAQLSIVSWDNSAAPLPVLASEPPQVTINEMQLRPAECDIFVAVLWSRLGTPPRSFGTRHGDAQHPSGTAWEIDDALQGTRGRPDVLIYRKMAPAVLELDTDWRQRGEQYDALQAYVSSLQRNLERHGYGGLHEYNTVAEFRTTIDSHLRHLIARRLGLSTRPRRGEGSWQQWRSPYPGLVAFTSADAAVFFGRDREVDQLVALVRRSPLTAVVGSSGSGKSSVIGAGLIPRLVASSMAGTVLWRTPRYDPDRRRWEGPRITPAGQGGDPSQALAQAIRAVVPAEAVMVPHGEAPGDLCRRLLRAGRSAAGAGVRILIVIDQFEEVFSVVDAAKCREFLDLAAALADEDLASIVLGMRADFLGPALEHEPLARHLRSATLPLGPPGLAAIRTMIEEPARIASLELDSDLPDLLLVDTRQEPGRLPLLAFTLSELYRCRDGNRLTIAAYRAIGGVQSAVGSLAERTFSALEAAVQNEFGGVFRQLLDIDEVGGPVRRPARLDALADNPRRKLLIDSLIAARLLVAHSEGTGEPVIEVAHEALFRGWPRLATLIDEAHDDMLAVGRMRRASSDWRACGDSLLLWPQERMDRVHAAIGRLGTSLTAEQREFLRPETLRLLAELENATTTHDRRREISLRLAALGDPRPGVGLISPDCPHIEWCQVILDDASEITFWIGKYPVTVAQLHAYRRSAILSDVNIVTGLEDVQPNLPAWCSWSEAVAFCRWFARRAALAPAGLPPNTPRGYTVRLPTEQEWVLSAGGPNLAYPWGPAWDEQCANAISSDLGRPIAVGMYPHGRARCGAADLSGTVWEWCDHLLESPADDVGELRAVRGGSALEHPDRCRIDSVRMVRGEVVRIDRGFRVCCGPARSDHDR